MTTTAIPLDHMLDLVSDTDINSYCFRAGGHVAATIGKKNGPVCGPLFSYRILAADSIEITGSDGFTDRWTNIRVEGALLHTECNGRAQTFTIRKPTP